MKLQRLLAAGALALASSLLVVPAAMADDETATVSVLHAVPGAVVDVYANGNELLKDFQPGTLTDPQMLPAGDYDLKVVAQGAGADGAAIAEANGVTVPAGANITVVANLAADGTPALNAFVNDTSASAEGGRVTVRHTAAAPAVDIRAGGTAVISGLENPKEAMLNIAPGTLNVDVTAAGTDTVVLGPADVTVAEGKNVIVYAWGSIEADNLALAIQMVDIMKAGDTPATPGMPSTGAEGPGSSTGITVALLGALAAAGAAVIVTRRQAVKA